MTETNSENTTAEADAPSKIDTAKVAQTATPKPTPQIIRRGGIGLLTATFMSCIAAVGGAYLSLFIQARPDMAQSLKIAQFLPKPAQSINSAELSAIKTEIAAIQAHIKNEGHAPSGGEMAAKIGETNSAAGAASNQNTANTNAPVLQNTTPAPAAVAAAQSAISLEPLRADMAGLSGRLTAIETRLAALDPTGTGGAIIAALQAEIATLKVTVADLQGKIAHTPSPATTFAVISLAEAANRNGAFMPEFEAVRAALPFLPEVAALEPLARKGAPTRALLGERFNLLAPIIRAGDVKAKEETGLVGWFRNLFAKAIKVKVKEENNPNAPEMVLARAKTKLDGGELSGAIDELKLIANPPKELQDWLIGANARLEIEGKIAALRGAIERGMNPQSQQPALGAPIANAPAVANAPVASNAPPPPLVPAPMPIAPVQPQQTELPNSAGAKR